MGVFKELTEGGLFNLPFLLHIYDENTNIYLISDNTDLTYNGHVFKAAAFEYKPGTNGDATLECSLFDRPELQNYILANRYFKCDLIGVYRGGEVVPLETYQHKYGDATWNGVQFEIKLNGDDRGNMTFPALIYNSYNNRGNA
jgi:hypothetical protein